MHTVNNLLQKLNYVKRIKYSVLNKSSISSCVKLSEQYTLGIMQNTGYLIWKGQNRKSQKLEL